MKSYSRGPTFLTMTGSKQVRSVVVKLAGDDAERVELTLPETGVCGGAGVFDAPKVTKAGDSGGGCVPAESQVLPLSAPATR